MWLSQKRNPRLVFFELFFIVETQTREVMSDVPILPPKADVETKAVLKKTAEAHRYLAELKGVALSIPNQHILIDTRSLQQARESSAIENIISTFDDVYQSNHLSSSFASPAAKEAHAYSRALKKGFEMVQQQGLLTNSTILSVQQEI
ncbi:MAG: Fic/DOC family N-terminal domain-containing protein, partial [Flavobacteriales bacterium]